ncbi:MAG: tRNA (adenosine(37)-N6)-dimethylallyltransferase MiaA, partial [Brachymonas sp.]|nr:tRNA (adenosine(37)-N6)-dimethylallyltransferase MiaA [Brachymonas sp.]
AHEQHAVPHHLIDIIDPAESYSAAQFARDAASLIASIRARNAVPLLVGGTMLYFKALFEGMSALPEADAALRAQMAKRADNEGWPALHAELARIDPPTAARLPPHDSQRIGRALEVWQLTGKPLSHWHAHGEMALPALPPARLLSLEPVDRQWLHARIAQRFDAMLEQGFIEEVRTLRARSDLHAGLPSIRCVGYRQAWEALDRHEPLEQWRDKAIAATRQLAKRQLTWLRSMPQRQVVACDAQDAATAVIAAAGQALNRLRS